MHLSCKKALPLLFLAAIACHDSTGPVRLTAQFELADINGRPVPTYLSPTPGNPPTILSATLALDNSGKVVMTEHRQEWGGTETTTTHTLDYRINDYRINDYQIEIGCFEPLPPGVGTVVCIANYTGTISGSALSLIVAPYPNGSIIYNYRVK